jgi:hypothetical protein
MMPSLLPWHARLTLPTSKAPDVRREDRKATLKRWTGRVAASPAWLLSAVAIAFVLVPLAVLVVHPTYDELHQALQDPAVTSALLLSCVTTCISTLIVIVLGGALAYLLAREDLRIDPDRVFLCGTSAGAMTALNLAFRLYGDKPMKEVKRRLPADFRIRGVANLWGSVHDLSVLENARVPILSFQSVADPVMPYDYGYPLGWAGKLFSDPMYGTHAVHEKALELGLRAEHHPVPEPRHRMHLDDALQYTPRFYEIRDAMAEFFAKEME